MSAEDIESQNYYENEETDTTDDGSDSTLENCESEEDASTKNLVQKSSSEILQERINSLKTSMALLRNELKEERELWKKEVEEAIKMSNVQNDCGDYSNENNIAKEYPIKGFTVAEYEQKLALYKEALMKAEAEKRASLQKQIAISNYKRRLLEVENMCNLELLRVKQNIQFLQPLQMMTSEWNLTNKEDNEKGAKCDETEDKISDIKSLPSSTQIEEYTNKLYNEMNNMFNRLAPTLANASMPQLSTDSIQLKGNELIAQSQSTIWYSSEFFPVSKF